MQRRALLAASLLGSYWSRALGATAQPLLARDFGAHPAQGVEWWYLTGALSAGTRLFGFQLTFFRIRVAQAQGMASALAARQLIIAHAAVSDLSGQRLWHSQRSARAVLGLAGAAEADTNAHLGDWRLQRLPDAGPVYLAQMQDDDFGFTLRARPTQPLLLQGEQGLSRKGPRPGDVSHYYSEPQLHTTGSVSLHGQTWPVQGTAWLDHEWSEQVMPTQAVGWDWVGLNLFDGSALTAFQLRTPDGQALYRGGSWRAAGAASRNFATQELRFQAMRYWISPHTQIRYPIEWQLQTPAGAYTVRALLPDQEIDARTSTGMVYWEGLSEVLTPQGQTIGRGYLEMTGQK